LLPSRFLAGFLLFAGSVSHFIPIGGLLPGMAFGGTPLDLDSIFKGPNDSEIKKSRRI